MSKLGPSLAGCWPIALPVSEPYAWCQEKIRRYGCRRIVIRRNVDDDSRLSAARMLSLVDVGRPLEIDEPSAVSVLGHRRCHTFARNRIVLQGEGAAARARTILPLFPVVWLLPR